MIAKPTAFFRRDLRISMSYPVTFVQGLATMVLGLISLSFLSRLVESGESAHLSPYGNDYFAFLLTGMAFTFFVQQVSSQLPGLIRGAQVTGTLEVLLASRTSLPALVTYSSLYGTSYAAARLVLALVLGVTLLGADLTAAHAGAAILILLLTLAAFSGIGILAAAFVLRYKQSEPFTGAIVTASFLLSGVIYPTTVLPSWLEQVAPLLPLTHTMSGLRAALLEGASTTSIGSDVLALAGFALLLPVSVAVFRFALQRAKAAGSLTHY